MKLELTLPSTPGFLHALPCLDIIALILIYPLLGASLVQETGVDVRLHESPWRYEQIDNPIVITIGAGRDTPIWVNKVQTTLAGLESEVNLLREQDAGRSMTTAVLRTDVEVASGVEKEVINQILMMGLHCKLLGKPEGKN
ncbi:MAG: ExbD/TolR family protein [Akkermansiaceae bacterium]